MTKTQLLLELNPTVNEKVSYLQKDFNLLTQFTLFNKIICEFNANPNQNYFNYIQSLLTQFIDFDGLNTNGDFSFYLIDGNGKMLISNKSGIFSSYSDYIANITYFKDNDQQTSYFYSISNSVPEKDGKILLEQYAYRLISKKNICPNYTLVGYVYNKILG